MLLTWTYLHVCINACQPPLGVCVWKCDTCGSQHVPTHASEGLPHMCLEAGKLHRWPPCGRQWSRWVQERERVEGSYKGTNEEGGGGLFAGPLGWRARTQRDAKHSQPFEDLSCWEQEALPLANLTLCGRIIHNLNKPQRFRPANESYRWETSIENAYCFSIVVHL